MQPVSIGEEEAKAPRDKEEEGPRGERLSDSVLQLMLGGGPSRGRSWKSRVERGRGQGPALVDESGGLCVRSIVVGGRVEGGGGEGEGRDASARHTKKGRKGGILSLSSLFSP